MSTETQAQKSARKKYQAKRVKFNFDCYPDEKAQIKNLAESKGMTMKELVFYLIEKELNAS